MRPLPTYDPGPEVAASGVRLLIGTDVRVVPSTAINSFATKDPARRQEFEREYGAVHEEWRKKVFDVLALSTAIMKSDTSPEAVAIAGIKNEALAKRAHRSPLVALGQELNVGTEGVVFAVWWSDKGKKFAPGLFCPDARAALYAVLLVQMGEPGSIVTCAYCRDPFIKSRGIRTHCSESCRAADASARYRQRKAEKNAANGEVS